MKFPKLLLICFLIQLVLSQLPNKCGKDLTKEETILGLLPKCCLKENFMPDFSSECTNFVIHIL